MSDTDHFIHREATITIELGLSEHGHHEIGVTVEGPDDDLPSRVLVEGALAMARDSLEEIYNGDHD